MGIIVQETDLGFSVGVGRGTDPHGEDTILSICFKNCMKLGKFWWRGWARMGLQN